MCQFNVERPGQVRLIVIDDGSQEKPASQFFRTKSTENIELYAVTEDVGFNNHGARNLGMKVTKSDWNFLSDIDRRYPDETFNKILDSLPTLDNKKYYRFTPMVDAWPHTVNDYVIHRNIFWETGGYDEEFVNIHWGDRLFFECLDLVAEPIVKPDWVVKYARKARSVTYADVKHTIYPDDSSLIHPNMWKNSKWREGLMNYVQERNKVSHMRKRKPILNFPWARIF